MKLGIMQQYYGQRPIKEIASAIKKDGFRCVQLSLVDENGAIPTQQLGAEDGRRFRNAFEAAEVEICALSGYTNLVDTKPLTILTRVKFLKLFAQSPCRVK